MKLSSSARYSLLLLSSFLSMSSAAADNSHLKDDVPCVARSPTTGLYFDLNAISLFPPEMKDGKKVIKDARNESWYAKGHDYPANFSINICAPVIEEVKDVVGVDSSRWQNISAYYEQAGKIYSIGEQASEPFFRGRKLVLNYTNGSPCPGDWAAANKNSSVRTKSTIMSFLCDRDAPANTATPSFVGTMDSCTYFFEVRSSAACGGIAIDPNGPGLGPAGVFGVIMLIAVAAYLIGGCAYQRTVMHQRGWRQCPNFSLWAGMVDFIKDMFVILFSSVGNCLRLRRSPSSRGYTRAGTENRGGFIGAIGGRRGSQGGRRDVDAENRLIDQLDEEWDD
ncbi:Vacuolar sorting receptor (Mrl1) [Penicillium macrosclerotiorum]|uniref:Vacuolar sorting receptor (Mrl1) n=1 Tax=Penicillium macrosclerotiorum TaxID=303699 RepID=UPI002548C0CD|nr:Vacuolar sorting receptor (Mrl1) [Penicillium macrosclerotiorum]KAJ5678939.1 Vacuolar sorting receptor (Mrl1) [Penicillium macrosclerotiorum]